jgi:hypothetical protein
MGSTARKKSPALIGFSGSMYKWAICERQFAPASAPVSSSTPTASA